MSDGEKRTPISIYLTPRAAMVLRQYSMGSGYGSLSRTVEEIILAFDFTYDTIKESMNWLLTQATDSEKKLTTADKAMFLTIILSFLTNINNAISRLNKETQLLGE